MRPLASPISDIKDRYEIVIVGSGYGGAIAASRLARAGRQVCVLERGKELQPGEYPDTTSTALREIQADLPSRHVASHTGLYDFRINKDLNVLVGCGLGGTSLINANVLLWPEPRVFDEFWPAPFSEPGQREAELDADIPTSLAAGAGRAVEMLQPALYGPPPGFPGLLKGKTLERSAAHLTAGSGAADVEPSLISVTFTGGLNHVGVEQQACQLCGDCVSGCNHGAKNTLLMNYLPDARAHRAELYTQVSARHLELAGTHWLVHYELVDCGRELFAAEPMCVRAGLVILAAGTLGSTEILLRSRAKGLPLSDRLGKGFSGNGDVLAASYNTDEAVNGVGFGPRRPQGRDPVGPCISGTIDLRQQRRLEDGMLIQDGSIPGALARVVPWLLGASALLTGRAPIRGLAESPRNQLRRWVRYLRGAYHGAVRHTQIFLVMSHDNAGGRMYLENDRLRIEWPKADRQPIFERVDQRLREANDPLRGTYVRSPLTPTTVHPLGGCAMADNAQGGVVNHEGQVFSCRPNDTAVYPSLYVCDGSIVPRSLGVNPLLTICALAERLVARLADQRRWTINYRFSRPFLPAPSSRSLVTGIRLSERPRPGIQFTERMTGYVSLTLGDDSEDAGRGAEPKRSPFECTLTVICEDLEHMIADPDHPATVTGTVTAPELSGRPMTVSGGSFSLFLVDSDQIGTRHMLYRMKLTADSGRAYYLEGVKTLNGSRRLHAWSHLTRLDLTLFDGPAGPSRAVVGRGLLTMSLADFLRQLRTVRARNVRRLAERVDGPLRFASFFAGVLLDTYGGVLAPPRVATPDAPPRQKPVGQTPDRSPRLVAADDLSVLSLRRHYRGGSKGPVILSPGFGMTSLCFSLRTVKTNLADYLAEAGYDVWLLDYRASPDLPSAAASFTIDDIALRDYPAAVSEVIEVTGARDVQVMAHCVGSMSLLMSLLAGQLEGRVRSAICSQLGAHPRVPALTNMKTGLFLAQLFRLLGRDQMTADFNPADWDDRLLDMILKVLPTRERCNNPNCRRIFFLFGETFRHDQLNTTTHDAIDEMFGPTSVTALAHLSLMVRRGRIVDKDGNDAYLPHLDRLKLPISFLHGQENQEFLPESTEITHALLCRRNGSCLYGRRVIPNYGHLDCFIGKRAAEEVFPWVLAELDRFN